MARRAHWNADRYRTLRRAVVCAGLCVAAACASTPSERSDADARAALDAANAARARAGVPALALDAKLNAAAERLATVDPSGQAGRAAVFAEDYAAYALVSGFVSADQPLDAATAMRRALDGATDLRLAPAARDFGAHLSADGRRWTYVIATPIAPLAADAAAAVLIAVNRERAAAGLSPLRRTAELDAAAAAHAADLAAARALRHEGADGRGPGDRAVAAGYDFSLIAENLAQTTEADAGYAVRLWRESPGHRRNMLTPEAADAGVAVVEAATGDAAAPIQRWWVMLYGRRWGA